MTPLFNSFDLSNRVALITGGAGLLGSVHATAILECGGRVVLADKSRDRLAKAYQKISGSFGDEKVFQYVMDVTEESSVQNVQNSVNATLGKVDILINNAAIDPKVSDDDRLLNKSRLENFSVEDWNTQIAVGLTGAFICSRVIGAQMAETGGGVIVNIASDLSVIAPDQRIYQQEGVKDQEQPVKPVAYSVIKHGLIGLTKYLATYWPDKGVRANALSPGGVFQNQPPEFVDKLVARIPIGRMANLDDYIGAVQFLTSDASRYMTGQNLVIDGGRTIW
jgi:NAD(P)-dependent dehydrogenase (short-subunit alcohol dehydrogenase family)